jgi:hypothetical protein
MKTDARKFHNLLGMAIQGDLGGITLYRNQYHHLVTFAMTWPKEPASVLQTRNRIRFRVIAATWSSLPQALRTSWLQVAARANLRITGYDLFTYYMLKADHGTIHTLEQQTAISLDPLPRAPVP